MYLLQINKNRKLLEITETKDSKFSLKITVLKKSRCKELEISILSNIPTLHSNYKGPSACILIYKLQFVQNVLYRLKI